MNNVVSLKIKRTWSTEYKSNPDKLSGSQSKLTSSYLAAQQNAREFSDTNLKLKAAVEKLEQSAREYRDSLNRIDARPLRRKSLRLARLMDNVLTAPR